MTSEKLAKGTPPVIEFCREVLRSDLASTCGGSVSLLVMAVAHKQDHLRRLGQLVDVYVDELKASIGISRDKSFREVRQRAVDAGWLTFQSGGTRAAGKYAAHLPKDYGRLAPLEAPQVAPLIPDDCGRLAPSIPAYSLSSVLNPISLSSPEGAEAKEQQTPKKKSRPPPTAEDADLARFVWDALHKMQPNRKPPDLDKWANDIRLMREADKRTPDEIRQKYFCGRMLTTSGKRTS
ncbi:MAG: hypothetical protein U0894_17330 [Pirellulales bacterium]